MLHAVLCVRVWCGISVLFVEDLYTSFFSAEEEEPRGGERKK
jgi:hypothetical protein